jgi:signal transduction histidine kinase
MQLMALRSGRDSKSHVHTPTARWLKRRHDDLGQAPVVGPKARSAAALLEELAQPLTAMLLNIDAAQLVAGNEAREVPQILRDMARDAERARQLIESLRAHLMD